MSLNKKCRLSSLVITNSNVLRLDETTKLELGKCHWKVQDIWHHSWLICIWDEMSWRVVGIYIYCKVEFNRLSYWLYSMPNLLVFQHLEILYLVENHVRVVCERMWRKAQDCALSKGLVSGSRSLLVACKSPKDAHEWSVQRS